MLNNSTTFLGLDLGDKHSHLAILDQGGEVIEETRLPTSEAAFHRKFSTLPSCRVAMEVGAQSRWVSHLLKELGHEVLVANARKLRAIYANPRKDDRTDAETLARLARLDPSLLSPIHHRSPQAQADLAVIRSRDALVRSRTLLINHVRGIVKSFGDRLSTCSANYFAKKVTSDIPEPLQPALMPILETIASLTQQIRAYDRQIESLCENKYPETKLLRNISGVGPLTALAYTLTLEDPQRFPKSRDVGPAIGLVPKRDQSGGRDPQLRITKTGNIFLRRLLVSSAQYILGPFGPDCELRRWGLRLADRGGKNAKKRAVVAVARKLAILLHHLWKNGEVYDPFYHKQKEETGSAAVSTAA
ncbi:MAG: IS110 family transposase [Chloroflexi bacterium]|nr:IS110 family transposase [Chloroflexota bacterium]